ncbi:antirestriction protein ArdA [Amycolatopsis samaneae]|uniref:Antirestriction protein ArdA n=1 Tax=Amycolatopsis samaneae TaxID=664691 RepID=A0ABW5GIA6_9PSEU
MEHQPHEREDDRAGRSAAEQPKPEAEHERRYRPRIYAADVASAARGIQHGLWIDANQPASDLDADIAAMLASSPVPGADTWAIRATKDFAGLDLTDVTDTALLSRVASGIAEHGDAYVAWVRHVASSDKQLSEFSDRYVGSYPSEEAWARSLTESLGWDRQLDKAITDQLLRPYVVIDYQAVAHDASASWYLAKDDDGTVHVFVR